MEPFSLPIPILMEDEIVHTDERPTCDDPECPCWLAFYEAQDKAEAAYIERGFMHHDQLPEFRIAWHEDDVWPMGHDTPDDTTRRYRHSLYYATIPEAEEAFELLDDLLYEVLCEMETIPESETRGAELHLVTAERLALRDQAVILSRVHPQTHAFNTREENTMNDPFESLQPEDFRAALDPSQWSVETTLHTPSFEATLTAEGHLILRRLGGALAISTEFFPHEVQALTRFLVNNVQLEPEEPPYDFNDFHPRRGDTEQQGE